MAPAKQVTKSQLVKSLQKLLEADMKLGDRAAIVRTIQILKGER